MIPQRENAIGRAAVTKSCKLHMLLCIAVVEDCGKRLKM